LFLKYWDNASTYSDTDFSTGAFWVQVHGLPLDMTSEKNARSIGSCFGDLLKIDYADSGLLCRKSFIRLRVQINLMDPLAPGFTHRRPPKEPTWIQYKYERLFDFCCTCGRLGHLSFSCPVEPKPLDSGFYGPLLKVVPPKVNLVDVLIQSRTPARLVSPASGPSPGFTFSYTTSVSKSSILDTAITLGSEALSFLSSPVLPALSSTTASPHPSLISKSYDHAAFNEKSPFVSKTAGPLVASTSKFPLVTNLFDFSTSSHSPISSSTFPSNTWPHFPSFFSTNTPI